MTISRIVALLTPIFAGLAGAAAAWVAKNVPGAPHLDATELTAVFIAVALAASQAAATWLKGRGLWEASKKEDGQTEPITLLIYAIVVIILVVVLFKVLEEL
jgi:H+/Cl- antiporter ClcA